MGRKLSCKVCGEHWVARRGTICVFYQYHEHKHNLVEPNRSDGELEQVFLVRWFRWRDQFFSDNLRAWDEKDSA